MRIAQVVPLFESVPPRMYGGTERVASYLTEELVRRGHDVTLFASGDSVTKARLVSPCKQALRRNAVEEERLWPHIAQLEQLRKRARSFDVVHFHHECLHFPLARSLGVPNVTTTHGRLDYPEQQQLWREIADAPLVSVSNAQRRPMPWANWLGTVYHGLPAESFRGARDKRGFLLFAGRISPEKRVDRAVEIARRAGMPLKIAAKVGAQDRDYFASVAPLLREPFVEFLGEVTEAERDALMAEATCLLFPIDWPEPFGLVMIEAMARGTPVLGWHCGSVPEVIDPGVTGLVVSSIPQAVAALDGIARLDRRLCLERARERFSVERMTVTYVRLYEHVQHHFPMVKERGWPAAVAEPPRDVASDRARDA